MGDVQVKGKNIKFDAVLHDDELIIKWNRRISGYQVN